MPGGCAQRCSAPMKRRSPLHASAPCSARAPTHPPPDLADADAQRAAHVSDLMARHAAAFKEMRAYYNQVGGLGGVGAMPRSPPGRGPAQHNLRGGWAK